MAKANDAEAPLARIDEGVPLDEFKKHPEEVPERCQSLRRFLKPLLFFLFFTVLCVIVTVWLFVGESNKMTGNLQKVKTSYSNV